MEWLPSPDGRVRFDLEMYLWPQPARGLRGSVVYSTDLFDAATIERLLGHFQTLLAAIVADPDQRVSEVPLLSEAERRQLLVDWNGKACDYPRVKCVHQLFEEQASRTPDAVAVVFQDQQLTYGELNAKANQLAHYLRSLGVRPDVLVGLGVERSLEMVVGLLGILKAGGAYVPLDPTLPGERLACMVEDAKVATLVTQEHLVSCLPAHHGQTVLIDLDWPAISACERTDPVAGRHG